MMAFEFKKNFSVRPGGKAAGFTMIELMVSVALFIVIGGTAFSLFSQHAPLFTRQQNLTGLNITMRNAVAQMQMDIVNAGTGYYPGTNFPDWPIGITIQNNPASTSCFNSATHTYTATCFDTLNVIAMDPTTPPSHPSDIGSNCVSTTSSVLFANPPTGITAATLASYFHSGDQVLLVKSDGSQMTTTILSKDGKVSGGKVQLQHNPTAGDGSNLSSDDPLGITTNPSNKLGTSFCTNDWIMKLAPVTYAVDATDPTDPKLTRKQNGSIDVIAEQVIGFKVGATIWNSASNTSSAFYSFDASSYAYNYSLIRSVRLSMIGRTAPNQSGGSSFQNSFDQGNYQIQAISIAVNPRNLSMRD
jgi:prepilin-type N-terminal cleavage/methylation domain-containing protein